MEMTAWPAPPKFEDKYEEREYLKGRLALAFRIFAKRGFDEGVAGHITLRVCLFTAVDRTKGDKTFEEIIRLILRLGSGGADELLGQPFWCGMAPSESLRLDQSQCRGKGG